MDNSKKSLEQIINKQLHEISLKISDAICPVDTLSLPVTVIVLENYVQILKAQEEFSKEAYQVLKAAVTPTALVADPDDPVSRAAFDAMMEEINEDMGWDQ